MHDPKITARHVAIYDEECGLCRRFIAMLRAKISSEVLVAVPCGHSDADRLVPMAKNVDCSSAFTLVTPTGKILQGAEAASVVVALAPSLKKFQWLIAGKAGQGAAKLVYKTAHKLRRRDINSG